MRQDRNGDVVLQCAGRSARCRLISRRKPKVRLQGRRIVVTGAASGMGAGVARLFAEEGAALALLDRNADGVRAIGEQLKAWTSALDVSDLASVEQAVEGAEAALGGLDGVVNAAGVLIEKPFAELDPESFNRLLGVNLVGPYNVIRSALPALNRAERATIVNIASVSGFLPMAGTSGYSASKAGLIMLGKSLALELGPKIRVNTICPGVIKTEMTRHIWTDAPRAERTADRVALKTLGEPEDIARAALFLSTEDSRFSTGTEIVVDGGFSWR
jgi:NAD(P)-dependent dehydrogenase (short-subunit alcohol dehydrogenase family)